MTEAELKQLRERRGWSQQQLAELLNGSLGRRYTSATVSQWELGKRKVPASVGAFLEELAINELLGDPAAPPPPPPSEDAPPGPGPAPPAAGSQAAVAIGTSGAYTRVCTELWEMVATGVGILGASLGNQALMNDGLILDADKDALGRAYGRLAETNETFRKMLLGATSSGVWLEVALVTGGTASKLWHNHLYAREVAAANGTPERPPDVEPVYGTAG